MQVEKLKLDSTVVDILSDIIKSQKFTNSDNIDFTIALINAKDNATMTMEGARVIKNFLNPNNYPKTKNPAIINLYRKYEYVHKYVTLTALKKRNIKSQLQPLFSKIK
jgi:hypothetical protein